MAPGYSLKCTNCGSTDLCFGYQGTAANVFVPSGTFTLHGYKTRSYVCMRCGRLDHFLTQEKLAKLREKLKIQFE